MGPSGCSVPQKLRRALRPVTPAAGTDASATEEWAESWDRPAFLRSFSHTRLAIESEEDESI